MLPRIASANPSTASAAAATAPPPRAIHSAAIGTSATQQATGASPSLYQQRKAAAATAVRDAWLSAPTAHDVLLLEAREALANKAVMKKALREGGPPLPPSSASAPSSARSSRVPVPPTAAGQAQQQTPSRAGAPAAPAPQTARPAASSVFHRRVVSSATIGRLLPGATIESAIADIEAVEDEKRLALLARQVWEFEVCGQMAQVDYVNSVIQPKMHKTVYHEREGRCQIRSDEATRFSEGILKSTLYARLKQLKQERDREERRKARVQSASAGSGSGGTAGSTPDEAERILREYREQFEAAERSPSLPLSMATPALSSRNASRPTGDDFGGGGIPREPQREDSAHDPKAPIPPPRATYRGNTARAPATATGTASASSPSSAGSQRSGPAVYGHTPNVLTLVQLRRVLDEMTYRRRIEAEEEQRHRDDLSASFASEKVRVQALADRRGHLERLIYWRKEREDKQHALEQQKLFADEQQALALGEEEARSLLGSDEASARATLRRSSVLDDHRIARLLLEQEETQYRVVGIETEQRITAATTLVLVQEHVARSYFVSHIYAQFARTTTAKKADIQLLAVKCLVQRGAIITIQRTWRSVRMGLLGWKRTHRSIGFFVQKHRAELQVVKNRSALTSYRNEVQAELDKEAREAWQRTKVQLSLVETEEKTKRELLRMDEALEGTGDVRRFRNTFIKRVFLPQLARLDTNAQGRARGALEDSERSTWLHLENYHAVVSVITLAREELRDVHLPRARNVIDADAQTEQAALHSAFAVKKAAIVENETAGRLRHANERAQVESTCRLACDAVQRDESHQIVTLYSTSQREHFTIVACDPVRSGRLRVAHVLYAVLVAQHERFALVACSMLEDELLVALRAVILAASATILARSEAECRRAILLREEDGIAELTTSEFGREKARVEAYMAKRTTAAYTLQRRLRDFYLGRLGHSATLAYLKAFFWSRRERAFLRAAHEATRRAVMSAQEELAREIATHNLATANEYMVLYQEIMNRIEPRRRDALVAHENYIWLIHVKNFETYEHELMRAERDQVKQHESYHRVKHQEAFFDRFRTAFNAAKANLPKDVAIRPFQRAWRCHVARRIFREKLDAAKRTLEQQTEPLSRVSIELEWLETLAVDVVQPVFARELHVARHAQLMLTNFHSFCFHVCRPALEGQERTRRLELLWHLQQHERYDLIESSEVAQRVVMLAEWTATHRAMQEVVGYEASLRTAQQQERTLFLLRVAASMEVDDRAAIEELEMVDIMGLGSVYHDHQRSFAHLQTLTAQIVLDELTQRKAITLDGLAGLDTLVLTHLDEPTARDAILVAAANRRFYLHVVTEDEASMRSDLQRELRRFTAVSNLTLQEKVGRTCIEQDWLSKLVVPSGAGVLRAVPTYPYLLQEMEAEQRGILAEQEDGKTLFWSNLRLEKQKLLSKLVIRGNLGN